MMRVTSVLGVVALLTLLPLSAGASWMQINLDIQGDGTSTFYQDSVQHPHGPDAYGQWNVMNVPALKSPTATTVSDPSVSLNDNAGNATPVVFQLFGDIAGWTGGTDDNVDPYTLVRDYFLLHSNFGLEPTADFEISGLDPGGQYELTYIHGVTNPNRGVFCMADLDGDGSLDGETALEIIGVDGQNEATVQFTASAAGKLVGLFDKGTHPEGDFAGLRLTAVPEPNVIVLILGSFVALCIRRRR